MVSTFKFSLLRGRMIPMEWFDRKGIHVICNLLSCEICFTICLVILLLNSSGFGASHFRIWPTASQHMVGTWNVRSPFSTLQYQPSIAIFLYIKVLETHSVVLLLAFYAGRDGDGLIKRLTCPDPLLWGTRFVMVFLFQSLKFIGFKPR